MKPSEPTDTNHHFNWNKAKCTSALSEKGGRYE